MESLLAHIDRVVAAKWVKTICDSNPASPISRFTGEVVLSEEAPEGWWDGLVSQRATESLQSNAQVCGDCDDFVLCFFFPFQISTVRRDQLGFILHPPKEKPTSSNKPLKNNQQKLKTNILT